MITLKEKHFDSFFAAPEFAYPSGFGMIQQLKSDIKRFLSTDNPLFRTADDFTYWTAFRDGKPVGRILCHIHHASNERFNWKRSYFGFFDVADDVEAARALLTKAEDFGRRHGCDEVMGNFNLTAMQQIGVVTKIFMPKHYTDQVYAPEYVARLLKDCGYEPTFPMKTFELDLATFQPDSLLGPKQKAVFENADFQFVDPKSRPNKVIIEAIRKSLNAGFIDNPMFVPLTWDEIWFQAKDMMLIIDRHIASLVEYKGEAVGVIVCIPNLNPFLKDVRSRLGLTAPYYFLKHKLRPESAVIIFYSVDKAFHSQGLNGAMLYRSTKALKERGYKTLGITWIAEENAASLRQTEKMGAKPMHQLHLFRKSLS